MRHETFPAKERKEKIHDHHFASRDQQITWNIITSCETEIRSLQKFYDHDWAVGTVEWVWRFHLDEISKTRVELQRKKKMFGDCKLELDKSQKGGYQETSPMDINSPELNKPILQPGVNSMDMKNLSVDKYPGIRSPHHSQYSLHLNLSHLLLIRVILIPQPLPRLPLLSPRRSYLRAHSRD